MAKQKFMTQREEELYNENKQLKVINNLHLENIKALEDEISDANRYIRELQRELD